MKKLSFFILSVAFLAACKSPESNNSKEVVSDYSPFYKHILSNSKFEANKCIDIEKLKVNSLIEGNNIKEVDTTFYQKYIEDFLPIEKEFEKLYYYGVNDKIPFSVFFIKVSRLGTTIYSVYFLLFNEEGELFDLLEVSRYESYPGGSVSMKSCFEINGLNQIELNSFVDGYDEEKSKAIITTDSICKFFEINKGKISLIRADSARYSK